MEIDLPARLKNQYLLALTVKDIGGFTATGLLRALKNPQFECWKAGGINVYYLGSLVTKFSEVTARLDLPLHIQVELARGLALPAEADTNARDFVNSLGNEYLDFTVLIDDSCVESTLGHELGHIFSLPTSNEAGNPMREPSSSENRLFNPAQKEKIKASRCFTTLGKEESK